MSIIFKRLVRISAASIALASAGCKFDQSVEGIDGGRVPFACTTDSDCVSGYFCVIAEGDPIGSCVDESAKEELCEDLDQDNTFVGPGCTDQVIDCNDSDPDIRPSASESCDGIDNDCDCSADSNGDGVVCGAGDENVDEELPSKPCRLQAGVCTGAEVACVDGAYADCGEAGVYGDLYEAVETTCDGLDNDCNGTADAGCECQPDSDVAVECGSETGPCTRGVKLCGATGQFSECVAARLGLVCANGDSCESDADCSDGLACSAEICNTNDDCGEGGSCVEEVLDSREDFFDTCTVTSGESCRRSVCRYLVGETACTDSSDCDANSFCVGGKCQPSVVTAINELCNGQDDNCNGRIDDDANRLNICGPCPFNMQLVSIVTGAGTGDFVCVDWYEASKPDATSETEGDIDLYTTSRPGVVPWTGVTPEEADAACGADASEPFLGGGLYPVPRKKLCKSFEWKQSCGGRTGTNEDVQYPYSTERGEADVYQAGVCVDGSLGQSGPSLTGTALGCCDDSICDMSGNVAEIVEVAGGLPQIAGGSYLDTDPAILACGNGTTYEPVPSDIDQADWIGFRCCIQRRD